MGTTRNLGGDRLGAGKKMNVHMHGYERSTHDLGYIFRSTMSAGTLVPFLCKVGQPGDTWDIDLNAHFNTHPTIGPLFGSFKVQLDTFTAPIRLYHPWLHNNKLKVGMKMSEVKLPLMELVANIPADTTTDLDNSQINPSSILAYLGIRGVGAAIAGAPNANRMFNALSLIAYWDIYKNYYANKQENIGAVIHTNNAEVIESIASFDIVDPSGPTSTAVPQAPATASIFITAGYQVSIGYTGTAPNPETVRVKFSTGQWVPLHLLCTNIVDDGLDDLLGDYDDAKWGDRTIVQWDYIGTSEPIQTAPGVTTFDLENIDLLRETILSRALLTDAFILNDFDYEPYNLILGASSETRNMINSQEGLAVKTYQSDLFNNWISTEWIDGPGGISELTAIDVTAGNFTIDQLNLSKKVYDLMNRIAVSGGSYEDWSEVTYDHQAVRKAETPMYMGGLIKELIFQEVVSNAESGTGEANQPLGTLAGKGVMAKKHKGGNITIKINEWSYVIGIISLTPRIDYSQGNEWDTWLTTMDDFHKPALDQIGFQDLPTERLAWWATKQQIAGDWVQTSVGKQPAWIEYMTSVNKTFGNFAIQDNEMFMTLNRRYEPTSGTNTTIKDLTTYIDPVKYNFIFADTALDAQNFWAQVAVDITLRRKISAKLIPNL